MFHEKGYLCEPLQHSELASLNNVILNPDLANFSCSATDNFVSYVDKVTQGEMYHHKAIYVIEEEKNHYLKIENLAKHERKSKILKMLNSLDDAKQMLNEECFNWEIKQNSKDSYNYYFYYLNDIGENENLAEY